MYLEPVYYPWSSTDGKSLIGEKIIEIRMGQYLLVFTTESGKRIGFAVEGDCCSHSYFYDFVGADKLFLNGPVTEFNEVSLGEDEYYDGEYIQVYGYEIVTEHPVWGEQTSVFSFRNASNGYYGGWMVEVKIPEDADFSELPLVTGEHYEVR